MKRWREREKRISCDQRSWRERETMVDERENLQCKCGIEMEDENGSIVGGRVTMDVYRGK